MGTFSGVMRGNAMKHWLEAQSERQKLERELGLTRDCAEIRRLEEEKRLKLPENSQGRLK